MDITEALMQLAAAFLAVAIPIIVAVVGAAAKRALDATQVQKYAAALRAYDGELYTALLEAGRVAVDRANDHFDTFEEENIRPFLYSQAAEISEAFSEKAGVRVDLTEARINTLVELAMREAKRSLKGL